ncbi:MAG: mechanosensitive ion channel [Alphaproteobacteria bacterium]
MLETIEKIDVLALWKEIAHWFGSYFFSADTFWQISVIAGASVIGSIVYRLTRPPLIAKIDALKIPFTAKRVLRNLCKLILPITAMLLIFGFTRAASIEPIGMDVTLSEAVLKLLAAWIFIRAAMQFIGNNLVRNFFALSIWVIAALSIFGVLDETTATLDAIGFNVGGGRLSALAVIKGLFSIFALLYLAMFVSTFAERHVLEAKSLNRSSQVLVAKIVRITLVVVALLLGVTSAGIDLSLFAVFGGAIGLGIGFGLQKGVSNLFSGMLLLMDRSIEPGDVLEMKDGTFGWVQHMGARYTEVVTRDNKSFLIPNEDFITQQVVNWSHGNTLIRVEVQFGVDYAHNPHEIIAMAIEGAANAHERICAEPAPVCHFVEFGDSSLNFKLRFWIKDAEKGVTNMRAAVMLKLWDVFHENNIKIPYPHREVLIRNDSQAA